ncbi:ABC transporter ATP-binding protein [Pyxidicoccus trucidator]|uniref:ABC transporter ATP-binding protein n=1 Tax=Pyxidicoccus trucidator TaxID=2709662 RepID=UPI001F071524|nr:ABC transporter ATP-binding protein [Pyxidicoccus trucidator]
MRRPGDIQAMAEMEVQRAADRSKVSRRLIGELRPWRVPVVESLLLGGVYAVTQGLGPYVIGRAIDYDIMQGSKRGLLLSMVALLVIYGVSALSQRAQTKRIGAVGQRVLASLRTRLFEQLLRLPLGYFDRRPIGDLMSRVGSDVDALSQFFAQGLPQLLGVALGLVGVLVAMLFINVRLALACFTLIPLMLLITWYFAARARRAYRKTRETVGDVTAELQEEIVGVRQAQAFNRTDVNIQRFKQRNAANRDANVAASSVTAAFSPVIEVLSTLSIALVLGYGGYLVFAGQLTVGVLAAFLIYVQSFFRPLQMLASVYTLMQSALAGAERVFAIFDETTEPVDVPQATVLDKATGRIELDHASFGYDPTRPVLHDVSFEAKPGQTVAIVGKTGAGKTTIASLIPRFYDVSSGAVRVDGTDVRQLTRESLRRQIAIVLQEPYLFTGTIAENIGFGRPGATAQEIEAAARAVFAHDFIAALPKGYDSVLGEAGATLSQGQRQLLAFARAVLTEPRILILDEATANIDMRTEALIQKALQTLLEGRTSVVIAHRLSTIRNADLILVMDAGRVVERGTHDELMALNGKYAELYSRQFASPAPAA